MSIAVGFQRHRPEQRGAQDAGETRAERLAGENGSSGQPESDSCSVASIHVGAASVRLTRRFLATSWSRVGSRDRRALSVDGKSGVSMSGTCPECGYLPVAIDAAACPRCGARDPNPNPFRKWYLGCQTIGCLVPIVIFGGILVLSVLGALFEAVTGIRLRR
jgi:hypothetical protein